MTSSILEVKNINMVWPEIKALSNIHFKLEENKIHSIIGPNGAGKSTFFGVISGEITPTSGKVWFLDEDVSKLPSWKRTRKGMGRAFQVPKVFPTLTIEENILTAVRIKEQWRDKLRLKGLFYPSYRTIQEADRRLKEIGLFSQKDKKVSEISHGDKKRLEIAIAISLEPKLLLLDEPTAGMSPEDTRKTAALIKRLHSEHQLTVLLTEHDMEVVFSLANKISVLNRGELIVTGKPEEIKNNDLVKEIYLGKEEENVSS
ncbi:ABC transporter ATP-binding protein [Alteribacillus sp. JSM 102045]|uniref:ABC transporter ATP-binding protein n=1 Tax=Alteribacillus sp. JSM 102045 TaxID=1562101 RepID=UPI0035C17DB7